MSADATAMSILAASAGRARRVCRWLLALMFLGIGASAVQAQITVVGISAPDPASSAVTSVTAAAPGGMLAGDVMLAIIANRGGDSSGISGAPSGWVEVTSTTDGARLGMYLYQKLASASEPADYTWTFPTNDRSAVAIMAFRGVDAANPIAAFGTRINGASTSVTAPSITPGVTNTMLVGFWAAINGNAVLIAPGSMAADFFVAGTGAGPNGLAMLGASATYAPSTATGTRVATSSLSLASTGYLVALRPGAVVIAAPGGFNAFETTTPSGAITGVIKTKVAGSSFSLALAALNSTRTAVLTSFTGSVTVELLDSSNNTGALNATTGCRSSWTPIQTVSPNPVFASSDNGRINASFSSANAWRDVRVRITHTSGGTTVIGCSTDNFAIRSAAFASLQATDSNDGATGTARVLNNTAPTSGVVHRAGRPFTVLAQAVSASGAATSGYSGTPTLTVASCLLPAGCGAGALTAALTGTAGTVTGSATYAEAGAISVDIEDSSFAAVDAADSTLLERTIRSPTPATFGRFVPDAYQLSVSTGPLFLPPLCSAGPSPQTFTYVGQPFAFGTVPVVLATPLNAAGAALVNARPGFVSTHLTYPVAATGAPVALSGTTTVASIAHSATSLITFNAGSFTFSRGTSPIPSFTPTLTMTVNLADTTENAVSGNSTINAASALTISPIAFAAGASTFHYGRVQLRPVYGDVRRELYLPLEVQRYNGLGWIALPEAGACLVAPATTFAYSNTTGLLTSGGGAPNCASRVATMVTTSGGRAAIRFDKPGDVTTAAPSAMTVTLNLLGAAAGTSCSGATPSAATTINAPWLANPDGSNPAARVTWGRQRGELLGLRERFD